MTWALIAQTTSEYRVVKINYTANTGTLDPDRRIEHLVIALYGDLDEPYRAVETLANKGLLAIADALNSGEIGSISDILPDLDMST